MIEKILIRAPKELKESLKENAKKIGMSLNGLILQVLWEWVETKGKYQE